MVRLARLRLLIILISILKQQALITSLFAQQMMALAVCLMSKQSRSILPMRMMLLSYLRVDHLVLRKMQRIRRALRPLTLQQMRICRRIQLRTLLLLVIRILFLRLMQIQARSLLPIIPISISKQQRATRSILSPMMEQMTPTQCQWLLILPMRMMRQYCLRAARLVLGN